MATKPEGPRNERTKKNDAGKPVSGDSRSGPQMASSGPTEEELNQRDRMKSGPRRQAGPPLEGDTAEPALAGAMKPDALPSPTDPKKD